MGGGLQGVRYFSAVLIERGAAAGKHVAPVRRQESTLLPCGGGAAEQVADRRVRKVYAATM